MYKLLHAEVKEIDPKTLLDGDLVYFAYNYTDPESRILGPFVVVHDNEGLKLRNTHGGKFLLEPLYNAALFYKLCQM